MQMIKFDKNAIRIASVVKLGFTYRAYNDILRIYSDPEGYACDLSKLTRLIITTKRNDSRRFKLHTSFGIFQCSLNQKSRDGFSVTSYYPSNLSEQNNALKNGIIFNVEKGVCVEVLLPDANLSYKYYSGREYDYHLLSDMYTASAVSIILDSLMWSKKINGIDNSLEEPIEHAVDEDAIALNRVLKQSEQYSILSSELDEKKTHEMGQMYYSEFFATDYDRIDRIAYSFIVDDIDQNVFKIGVQIEMEGIHNERINGEIVDIIVSADDDKKIVILFNKQVDINLIQPFGIIYLSFSTVNKRVQLDANEKISDGSSKAQYMKRVIGGNSSLGFESKDISKLKNELNSQKYPPNLSQMTAIEKGINSKDIFLVMGPPGTGKTTVIAAWVKYFVETEHKRVLISSQNNKAVDNVLARLVDEKHIDVIRIGSESKIQNEIIPYMFENKLISLNQSIDAATRGSIEKIEKTVSDWREYRNSFYVFDRVFDEFYFAVTELRESIRENLIPLRAHQKVLASKYYEKHFEYTEMQKRYDECVRRIKAYQNSNIIFRFFLKTEYTKNVQSREELKNGMEKLNAQILGLREEYKNFNDNYLTLKQIIKAKFVSKMSRATKQKNKMIEEFERRVPTCSSIAGLFENCEFSAKYAKSMVIMKGYLNKIDKELKRANELLCIEKEWRNDVIGKQNYALNEIILETVDLVGATCIGVSSQKRFADLQFDVTIIDEAGQIQIHNALVPMSVSNKLIMLGDYKQIPPSVDQEMIELCELNDVDPELLKKSLFEKLFEELPYENKILLDTQYRIPGEIADIISEWFYAGEYKSPEFKRNLSGLLPDISSKPFILIDTSGNKDRHEIRTDGGGTYNSFEASICREILAYILKKDIHIEMSEIGIISAYADQVSVIKNEIEKLLPHESVHEMAATLDSFQGQERDLIIYSFTKSSNKKATRRRIGFLNELRRLNVAMSRSKKTLVMIGDMKFLSGCLYQDINDDGDPIYKFSEKEFSDFILKLIRDVKNGRGEYLHYDEFKERIGA